VFHFAWADASETTFGPEHEVEDEDVLALRIAHQEGDFAQLQVDVRNPRVGLLSTGRKRWAWLSWTDDLNPTAGATALFFGRLVGLPDQLDENVVSLAFVARPEDFDTQKRALAETLKVQPFYDPLWLNEESRDDPDAVLEARTQLWHIDRVTHEVTVSDILQGEDGIVDVSGAFLRDSLTVDLGSAPVRKVKVTAEVSWDQTAAGNVDLTSTLLAAFAAAGSRNGFATSYTGEGLMRDWPEEGDRIGGGWEFGSCSVDRVDGIALPTVLSRAGFNNGHADFPLWALSPTLTVNYDVARKRIEVVTFTLNADCQAILTEPGDEEVIEIEVASEDAGLPIDPADTDNPDGIMPIGDLRNRAYFPTDRGKRSLEYLIALARAQLLSRARAANVSFSIPWRMGLGLSLRKSATITDPRLPGGTVSGKIIGYELSASGTGEFIAHVSLGCTVGKGNTVSTVTGSPVYVVAGYSDDWQLYSGATYAPIAGEVTYEEFGDILPNDDGVDFFNMRAVDLVEQMTVYNGQSDQKPVLDAFRSDAAEAINALNQVFTEVDCDLKVLKAGPFTTEYPITVSDLMVARTIDLEAGVTA